ncbi:MAG: hypothetical protein K6G15_08455 [Desulfovibrio sp.]|nr:hypothetical protein [Desulfovibrio sp.]
MKLVASLVICGCMIIAVNRDALGKNTLNQEIRENNFLTAETFTFENRTESEILNERFSQLESELEDLQDNIEYIHNELRQSTPPLKSGLADVKAKTENSSKEVSQSSQSRASLQQDILSLTKNVSSSQDFHIITVFGILFSIILSFHLFDSLKKIVDRQQSSLSDLLAQSAVLNTKIIDKFQASLEDLDLATTIISEQHRSISPDISKQHEIIKIIANKITFMEVTLSRMDKSIRGYKQLTKSISQIKDHLKSNGYEVIEMLGKPYNSGMKVIANFIDDEDLEKGKQIITGVTKPQINYNGLMIQSAQIVVTQNL